jgi:hypothetical protein
MMKIRAFSTVFFTLFTIVLSSCSDDLIVDPGLSTIDFANFGVPLSVFGNRIVKTKTGDLLLATGGGLYRYKFSSGSWGIVGNEDMYQRNIGDVALMQNGNIVCASPDRALFLSIDNGDTWSTTLVSNTLKSVRFFIGNKFEAWASVKGEDGKYTAWRTENYGVTWAQRVTPKNSSEERISLCFNSADHVFFANGDGLYRSLDSGRTYQLMTGTTGIDYIYTNKAGNILAFTSAGGKVSTDSGRGLADVTGIPGGIKEVITSSTGTLYGVASYSTPPNEAVLYSSDDDGMNWLTTRLFGRPVNSLTEVGSQLYLATSGFGVLTSQNMNDWSGIGPGISTTFSIAVDKDNNVLTASYGIYRSSDGNNWTDLGITSELTRHIAASPQGYMMRFSGGKYYASSDNGANWLPYSTVVSVNGLAYFPNGSALLTSEVGVSMSTDAGKNFASLPIGKTVDAQAIGASTLYSIYFSYKDGSSVGLTKSLDSGKTFSNANSGIENILMTSIAVNSNGTVYASDGYKLYSSKDSGAIWTTYTISGLAGGDKVNTMTFRNDGNLYLGTNTAIIRSKAVME